MPESPEESQIQTLKPTHKRCLSGGIQSSKTISSEITLEMGEEFKDKIHKEFLSLRTWHRLLGRNDWFGTIKSVRSRL